MIRGAPSLFTEQLPLDESELHKVFYPSSRDPMQAALTEQRPSPQQLQNPQQQSTAAAAAAGGERLLRQDEFDYEMTGDDIKTALDKARKRYGGGQFGKFQRTRKELELLEMNEEEFKETGGLRGHVERGRSLFFRQSYGPAIRYLEFAIVHGRRELSNFAAAEPYDIVLARQLLAQCLLAENRHREAQAEADRILAQQRRNTVAMLVKAEAHYHQCHFERALLIFCRGARSRVPLYADVFDQGVQKSIVVIKKALSILEDKDVIGTFLSKVSDRVIKRKTAQQRQFEILVHKEFQNADLPEPLTKSEKELEESTRVARHPHLILTFDLPSFEVFPVMNLSASGPLAFIKEKFRKQREKIREDKMKQQINQMSGKEDDKKRRRKKKSSSSSFSSSSSSQKLDVNMKRLGSDEEFLDFLRGTVLDNLQKRLDAQNPRKVRRSLQKRPPPPLPPPSASSAFGDCLLPPDGLGLGLGGLGLGGGGGRFDRGLVDAADEALGFIGGRKTFWTAIKEKSC